MTAITENPMQDAPASVETTYTISVGDGFEGRLEGVTDQDWVRVEMIAGKTYSITFAGVGPDANTDTILSLYDSGVWPSRGKMPSSHFSVRC